ncbi:hypothetical protein ACFV08_13340 [Streptomyces fradiae]|uniref:hypothetical protein n=1 Tax=Streptomyces fradiae TaxID=1906 RepID=UPI0036BBAC84
MSGGPSSGEPYGSARESARRPRRLSGDGRADLLATDGRWPFRCRGLSTGGVAAAEKTGATRWSLNGVF